MTLPDEVVKEIDKEFRIHVALLRHEVDKLCEVTRRLTIEECAKECERIAVGWGSGGIDAIGCAEAIRQLGYESGQPGMGFDSTVGLK